MPSESADSGRDPPPPVPEPSGTSDRSSKPWRAPRAVIARRELASLKSEKTIVLALAIQLFVAAFSSFLVVGLVSLYSPSNASGFQPELAVTGNASEEVITAARNQEGLEVRAYSDQAAAMEAFATDQADAVLRAERTPEGAVRVVTTAPQESLRTTLVVVQVREVLESLEQDLRQRYAAQGRLDIAPIAVPEQPDRSNPYFGFTYTVLVPLLMFLPVFISGSIVVDSLTEEIQRGTLELLRSAPITLSTIVDAKVVSTATLAPAQAALWIALLELNGTGVDNWPALLGIVAGLSTTVVAVGAGIALVAPDRRQAQFLFSSGILLLAVVGVLLPEHPANTIAKLAIGSATEFTWLAAAAYLVLGAVAYFVVRVAVRYVDPEGL